MFTPKSQAATNWEMDKVVTFDIEAYDWTNPIALGYYIGSFDEYVDIIGENCIKEFVEVLLQEKTKNFRFVAHNGGKYDFIPIIEELSREINRRNKTLEKSRWELDIITKGLSDTPFLVTIDKKALRENKDGELEYRKIGNTRYLQDSLALLPRSLKSLSESFVPDMPKLDFDVERIKPLDEMDSETVEEMRVYLERDCRTLNQVLKEFTSLLHELTGGKCGPQMTIGSTAMEAYRTTFMPDIEIADCYRPEQKQNPEACFRESYYGGRTEVYTMHGENLKHYDVNSLYPYVYSQKPIPIGNVVNTGKHFPYDDESVGGVLKIRGTVSKSGAYGLPVLPKRVTGDFQGEKVVFGYGQIEGWYMASEVRYADKVGSLTDFEIVDSYASSYGKPFESYGNALYDKKKSIDSSKNPGLYMVVKLLLNSFYGKFGMDREQSKIVHGPVTRDFQVGKRVINDRLANQGFMAEDTEASANYILPRIASAITAHARIEMHKWFMKIKEEGGEIWYCDTDSIVTNVDLPEGEELGEMDLEGVIDEAYYLAPKVYAELVRDGENVLKAKGMRGASVGFRHYEKAYHDQIPELVNASWTSPRGFKAGMKNDSENWFTTNDYSRSLRSFDLKREHYEGGSNPKRLDSY